MKKILSICLFALFCSSIGSAQMKNVTFIVNTATVSDTIGPNSVVQIRGSKAPLYWEDTTKAVLTNIGGDYWSWTGQFNVDDTIRFKIHPGSWESNLNPADPLGGGDRSYIVTNNDTILPVQFPNFTGNNQDQYWRPWTAIADTFINVYFRVNMDAVINGDYPSIAWDDAYYTSIAVRGGGKPGDDLSWGASSYLQREGQTGFFSGRLKFRKSNFTVGEKVEYKFLIGSDWGKDELQGGKPNRSFNIPVGLADTTLYWAYFDNQKPVTRENKDTVVVKYRVNMATAIQKGGFSNADTIVVQSGFFGTSTESGREKELIKQGFTGSIYEVMDTIITSVNKPLDYQYYLKKNGNNIRENYFNFQYSGSISTEQERRQMIVPSKSFTILDTVTSVNNARRQPIFPNQKNLAQNVRVKWVVNMKPAYYQILLGGDSLKDQQGNAHVKFVDSIKAWGVWMNGPAVGGWDDNGTYWGLNLRNNVNKKLWDDGTHGDATANDTIYTFERLYTTSDKLGQEFKLGIYGGDNESNYGLNHYENIVDIDTVYTIYTQWGSINPNFYDAWDYDLQQPKNPTSVKSQPGVVEKFELSQNYPNPFNPTTTINFSVPKQAAVKMVIYNMLGQEVATVVNETLKAGKHSVAFNASRYASGIYFYKMTAGDFVEVKKMILMK